MDRKGQSVKVTDLLQTPYSPPEGESKRSFSVSVGGDTGRNPPTELAALRPASSCSPSRGEQGNEPGRACLSKDKEGAMVRHD